MATDTDIVSSESTNRPAAARRNGVEGSLNCGPIANEPKSAMAALTDTSDRASQARVITVEEPVITNGRRTVAFEVLATTVTAPEITVGLN
jgi:hypothetical protein